MLKAKKKILYIISSLNTGGAEVALLSAIPALNKSFDFRLVCLKKYDTRYVDYLTENERRNIVTFAGLPFNYFRALWFILKFNPEIVISSLWKGAILGIMTKYIKPRIKYIEFIHSTVFFHFLDRIFTIWAVKVSDILFFDSISSKYFISKYIISKQSEIISFLQFDSPKSFELKTSIKLKALYVGRFHKQKRIDRLVYFVKNLIDFGLNFEVDLYGRDDGSMNLIKQLIIENKLENNIVIKGEIPSNKVKQLFQNYDFYFQTSEIEGMAMSVIEAMQHGLVCVLTNVGEIKNYARDGENAIIIYDPFDVKAKDAVLQLKETTSDIKLYNKLSENAYKEFRSKDRFCDSLVNELNKITFSK